MLKREHPLNFDIVIAKMKEWRDDSIAELRSTRDRDKTVALKRRLDQAMACLEFCQLHQIRPDAEVMVLPETRTRTPSSNYRIVEDHESDRPGD